MRAVEFVTEAPAEYKEIEFVCVNPQFPDATDPALQKKMYRGLKQIDGVVPLWQEWGDYSEGQASLSAIYQDSMSRDKILSLAKQLGVKVDLEQAVSDDYVDRAMRGEHEGQRGLAEGQNNLSYIGNCTDDDVIEHVFGDATGFAQAVEEYGDEFVLDDLVVKYDPETDVHSFYYQQQGLTERKQSPLEDFEGLKFRMVNDNDQLFVNAFDSSGGNELGHVTFDIGDGKELDPQNLYVKHKVRSQGIARTMYDFVKSKGYKIQRSWDQTDAGAGFWDKHRGEEERVWEQDVAEGKITLSTDPDWYGAEVGDYKASGPVVNIPANQLVGFEPDDKMNQPKSKANVEKIVAGLKQGDKLPPLLVRKYKDGYQVLDGHHRFWAYKLLGVKSIPAQIVPAEDIEEIDKQGMAENFADGRNPQDKGDAKRHGINTKASVSSLRKTAKQGGRKGQLAHWLANMKSGRAKKK